MSKVWFITGAGRGLGIDIAQRALAAGHSVVATGRDADRVLQAVGARDNLLTVPLDITDPDAAMAAAKAAVDRFGRIDVLVNNAGNFHAGYFEEISAKQFRAQMETNFFGPLNVTRAILPVMRQQRSGQVITITSTAGLIGQEFVVAYAASKFALEGWMESLRFDVAPYGIRTMSVEPGFFRTELLVEGASTIWPELSIKDYADRTAHTIAAWKGMNGQQGGDPAKLAAALVTLSDSGDLPLRFVAGVDAMAAVEANLKAIQGQIDVHRDLSASLAFDDAWRSSDPADPKWKRMRGQRDHQEIHNAPGPDHGCPWDRRIRLDGGERPDLRHERGICADGRAEPGSCGGLLLALRPFRGRRPGGCALVQCADRSHLGRLSSRLLRSGKGRL
jgi:NAD(P)-dependent dehydrogenase (short-subunit alcohol dehydrogenase family)